LGAKVSIKGLEAYRNSYPPQDVFSPEETYHIDILSKQVGENYTVDSDYWVADSDSTVPAVFLDWRQIHYNRSDSGFDRSAKAAEIDSIITRRCGPGRIISLADRKSGYTEWHSARRRSSYTATTTFVLSFIDFPGPSLGTKTFENVLAGALEFLAGNKNGCFCSRSETLKQLFRPGSFKKPGNASLRPLTVSGNQPEESSPISCRLNSINPS